MDVPIIAPSAAPPTAQAHAQLEKQSSTTRRKSTGSVGAVPSAPSSFVSDAASVSGDAEGGGAGAGSAATSAPTPLSKAGAASGKATVATTSKKAIKKAETARQSNFMMSFLGKAASTPSNPFGATGAINGSESRPPSPLGLVAAELEQAQQHQAAAGAANAGGDLDAASAESVGASAASAAIASAGGASAAASPSLPVGEVAQRTAVTELAGSAASDAVAAGGLMDAGHDHGAQTILSDALVAAAASTDLAPPSSGLLSQRQQQQLESDAPSEGGAAAIGEGSGAQPTLSVIATHSDIAVPGAVSEQASASPAEPREVPAVAQPSQGLVPAPASVAAASSSSLQPIPLVLPPADSEQTLPDSLLEYTSDSLGRAVASEDAGTSVRSSTDLLAQAPVSSGCGSDSADDGNAGKAGGNPAGQAAPSHDAAGDASIAHSLTATELDRIAPTAINDTTAQAAGESALPASFDEHAPASAACPASAAAADAPVNDDAVLPAAHSTTVIEPSSAHPHAATSNGNEGASALPSRRPSRKAAVAAAEAIKAQSVDPFVAPPASTTASSAIEGVASVGDGGGPRDVAAAVAKPSRGGGRAGGEALKGAAAAIPAAATAAGTAASDAPSITAAANAPRTPESAPHSSSSPMLLPASSGVVDDSDDDVQVMSGRKSAGGRQHVSDGSTARHLGRKASAAAGSSSSTAADASPVMIIDSYQAIDTPSDGNTRSSNPRNMEASVVKSKREMASGVAPGAPTAASASGAAAAAAFPTSSLGTTTGAKAGQAASNSKPTKPASIAAPAAPPAPVFGIFNRPAASSAPAAAAPSGSSSGGGGAFASIFSKPAKPPAATGGGAPGSDGIRPTAAWRFPLFPSRGQVRVGSELPLITAAEFASFDKSTAIPSPDIQTGDHTGVLSAASEILPGFSTLLAANATELQAKAAADQAILQCAQHFKPLVMIRPTPLAAGQVEHALQLPQWQQTIDSIACNFSAIGILESKSSSIVAVSAGALANTRAKVQSMTREAMMRCLVDDGRVPAATSGSMSTSSAPGLGPAAAASGTKSAVYSISIGMDGSGPSNGSKLPPTASVSASSRSLQQPGPFDAWWPEKHRPLQSSQVCGNGESVASLRDWLAEFREALALPEEQYNRLIEQARKREAEEAQRRHKSNGGGGGGGDSDDDSGYGDGEGDFDDEAEMSDFSSEGYDSDGSFHIKDLKNQYKSGSEFLKAQRRTGAGARAAVARGREQQLQQREAHSRPSSRGAGGSRAASRRSEASSDADAAEARASLMNLHTLAYICGPTGSGKTAAVYACASELGYGVIEVHPGEARNKKALLDRLKEATQSRRMHVGGAGAAQSDATSVSAITALLGNQTSAAGAGSKLTGIAAAFGKGGAAGSSASSSSAVAAPISFAGALGSSKGTSTAAASAVAASSSSGNPESGQVDGDSKSKKRGRSAPPAASSSSVQSSKTDADGQQQKRGRARSGGTRRSSVVDDEDVDVGDDSEIDTGSAMDASDSDGSDYGDSSSKRKAKGRGQKAGAAAVGKAARRKSVSSVVSVRSDDGPGMGASDAASSIPVGPSAQAAPAQRSIMGMLTSTVQPAQPAAAAGGTSAPSISAKRSAAATAAKTTAVPGAGASAAPAPKPLQSSLVSLFKKTAAPSSSSSSAPAVQGLSKPAAEPNSIIDLVDGSPARPSTSRNEHPFAGTESKSMAADGSAVEVLDVPASAGSTGAVPAGNIDGRDAVLRAGSPVGNQLVRDMLGAADGFFNAVVSLNEAASQVKGAAAHLIVTESDSTAMPASIDGAIDLNADVSPAAAPSSITSAAAADSSIISVSSRSAPGSATASSPATTAIAHRVPAEAASLILFEAGDVLLSHLDKGFLQAVKELAAEARCPIIITASTLPIGPAWRCFESISMHRFLFLRPSLQLLSMQLSAIALAEGLQLSVQQIRRLASGSNCDIRKALCQLQLWGARLPSPQREALPASVKAAIDSACQPLQELVAAAELLRAQASLLPAGGREVIAKTPAPGPSHSSAGVGSVSPVLIDLFAASAEKAAGSYRPVVTPGPAASLSEGAAGLASGSAGRKRRADDAALDAAATPFDSNNGSIVDLTCETPAPASKKHATGGARVAAAPFGFSLSGTETQFASVSKGSSSLSRDDDDKKRSWVEEIESRAHDVIHAVCSGAGPAVYVTGPAVVPLPALRVDQPASAPEGPDAQLVSSQVPAPHRVPVTVDGAGVEAASSIPTISVEPAVAFAAPGGSGDVDYVTIVLRSRGMIDSLAPASQQGSLAVAIGGRVVDPQHVRVKEGGILVLRLPKSFITSFVTAAEQTPEATSLQAQHFTHIQLLRKPANAFEALMGIGHTGSGSAAGSSVLDGSPSTFDAPGTNAGIDTDAPVHTLAPSRGPTIDMVLADVAITLKHTSSSRATTASTAHAFRGLLLVDGAPADMDKPSSLPHNLTDLLFRALKPQRAAILANNAQAGAKRGRKLQKKKGKKKKAAGAKRLRKAGDGDAAGTASAAAASPADADAGSDDGDARQGVRSADDDVVLVAGTTEAAGSHDGSSAGLRQQPLPSPSLSSSIPSASPAHSGPDGSDADDSDADADTRGIRSGAASPVPAPVEGNINAAVDDDDDDIVVRGKRSAAATALSNPAPFEQAVLATASSLPEATPATQRPFDPWLDLQDFQPDICLNGTEDGLDLEQPSAGAASSAAALDADTAEMTLMVKHCDVAAWCDLLSVPHGSGSTGPLVAGCAPAPALSVLLAWSQAGRAQNLDDEAMFWTGESSCSGVNPDTIGELWSQSEGCTNARVAPSMPGPDWWMPASSSAAAAASFASSVYDDIYHNRANTRCWLEYGSGELEEGLETVASAAAGGGDDDDNEDDVEEDRNNQQTIMSAFSGPSLMGNSRKMKAAQAKAAMITFDADDSMVYSPLQHEILRVHVADRDLCSRMSDGLMEACVASHAVAATHAGSTNDLISAQQQLWALQSQLPSARHSEAVRATALLRHVSVSDRKRAVSCRAFDVVAGHAPAVSSCQGSAAVAAGLDRLATLQYMAAWDSARMKAFTDAVESGTLDSYVAALISSSHDPSLSAAAGAGTRRSTRVSSLASSRKPEPPKSYLKSGVRVDAEDDGFTGILHAWL